MPNSYGGDTMKKLFLKLAFSFSTVLFYQNTYANDIMDIFPRGFTDSIVINKDLDFTFKNDLEKKLNFKFEKHNSKELKWSVNNTQCAINKKQRCIGIYEQPLEEKSSGSQSNALSDITSNSTYTLLKIDKTDSKNNTVYKCKSKYNLKFSLRNSASINNCATYTKNSCKIWNDFLNKNSGSYNNLKANATKCDLIEKEIKQFSTELNNTFTTEFNNDAKTDISVNFDSVTKQLRSGISPLRTDSNIQPLNTNSSIFVYNDIVEKTKDCAQFANFFDNPFNSIKPATNRTVPSGRTDQVNSSTNN